MSPLRVGGVTDAFEVTGHVFELLQLQIQLLAIAYLRLLKKALQKALQQRLLHAHGCVNRAQRRAERRA